MNMIKLSKIEESSAPKFMSGDWKDYIPGQDNPGVSIPINYWIKGAIDQEPEVGKSLIVARTERNGVECIGIFMTSPIIEISEGKGNTQIIETANSVYLLEPIDD